MDARVEDAQQMPNALLLISIWDLEWGTNPPVPLEWVGAGLTKNDLIPQQPVIFFYRLCRLLVVLSRFAGALVGHSGLAGNRSQGRRCGLVSAIKP